MGWSKGGPILEAVAKRLEMEFGGNENPIISVLRSRKAAVLKALISELEDLDADDLGESVGVTEALDLALSDKGYHVNKDGCQELVDWSGCSCGYKY